MNRIATFADLFHANGQAPRSMAINRMADAVANYFALRTDLARRFTGRKRNLFTECDFPERPTADNYQSQFERNPIAHRVVTVWPRECWQVQPTVYETEDVKDITEFEKAWDAIGNGLRGKSWFRSEQGSPVWDYLKRLDEISGIGQYGTMLYGFNDGLPLSEPVAGVEETGSIPSGQDRPQGTSGYSLNINAAATQGRKLLYLRVFPEALAQITQWESNPNSPRYGQPVQYQISFVDPDQDYAGIGQPTGTRQVHWTRILHVADNRESNEVLGTSRMRPVLNNLLSIDKILASDGEACWLNAFLKVFFETEAGVDVNITAFRDDMEKMFSGSQPWGVLNGMAAKSIAPAMADPTPHLMAQLQAISIQLEIPQRVFMGSERGQLASSQDQKAWNKRVGSRQNCHITPSLICPFVDRLIMVGCLPEPAEGYLVDWPSLDIQTESEQADVAVKRTQAMSQYVSSGVRDLMTPADYLTRELGYDEEEAKAIMDATDKARVEAKKKADAEKAKQPLAPPVPIPGQQQPPATTQPTAEAGQVPPDTQPSGAAS